MAKLLFLIFLSIILTISQNTDMSDLSIITFGGPGHDKIIDMCTDKNNNLYIGGVFDGSKGADFDPGSDSDYIQRSGERCLFVSKYSDDGEYLWTKTWESEITSSSLYPLLTSISSDSRGNIVISGNYRGTLCLDPVTDDEPIESDKYSGFLIKIDMNGNYLFGKTFDTEIASFTFDEYDNIIAVGKVIESGTSVATVRKFDDNGETIWIRKFGGNDGLMDSGRFVFTYESEIIVIGMVDGIEDLDPGVGIELHDSGEWGYDQYFMAFDYEGNYLWSQVNEVVNLKTGTDFEFYDSNIFLTGVRSFIRKFSIKGDLIWEIKWGSLKSYSSHIDVGKNSDIYVSGLIMSAEVDLDPSEKEYVYRSESYDSYISCFSSDGEFKNALFISGEGIENCKDIISINEDTICAGGFFNNNLRVKADGFISQDFVSSDGWDCFVIYFNDLK